MIIDTMCTFVWNPSLLSPSWGLFVMQASSVSIGPHHSCSGLNLVCALEGGSNAAEVGLSEFEGV